LVENVFKHGYLQGGNRPAAVKLKEEEGLLFLSTSNMKRPSMHVSDSGIGKREVTALLEQHYRDRHQLHVTETDTHYLLELKLQL
jgi:two-component sensor histidine kinase